MFYFVPLFRIYSEDTNVNVGSMINIGYYLEYFIMCMSYVSIKIKGKPGKV